MVDIAPLGYSVDTSGLKAGEDAVNRFADANRKAAPTVDALGKATETATGKFRAFVGAQNELANTASAINSRLNVNDSFASPKRASDIAAYGKSLDDLRAKYNPLFAAGQQYKATLLDITNAQKLGALSAAEAAQAITITKSAFASQVVGIRQSTGELAQGWNLNRQGLLQLQASGVNTFQALASGMNPFIVAQTQAAQVLGAFVQGGVIGFKSLVTAGAPVIAVLAGIGIAVASAVKYNDQLRAMQLALVTTGNAIGLTVDDLLRMSDQIATAANISRSAARDITTALVNAGALSEKSIELASSAVKGFAKLTGTDLASAATELGKKLQDPTKAASELGKQIGLLSEAEARQIELMQRSGDAAGAQAILLSKVAEQSKLVEATVRTGWGRALDSIGTFFSNLYHGIGEAISGTETLGQKQAYLQKQIEAYSTNPSARFKPLVEELRAELRDVNAQIALLEAQTPIQKATTAYNKGSFAAAELGRSVNATPQLRADNAATQAFIESQIKLGKEAGVTASELAILTDTLDRLRVAQTQILTPTEEEDRKTADLRTELSASIGTRAIVAAGIAEYNAVLKASNSVSEATAAKLAAEGRARMQLADAAKQSVIELNAQTDGLGRVADAYGVSTASGIEAEARLKAEADARRNATLDIEQQTKAYLDNAAAQSLANAAKQNDALKQQLSGQERLASASPGGSRATQEAQRQNELEAYRQQLLAANDNIETDQIKQLVRAHDELTASIQRANNATEDGIAVRKATNEIQIENMRTQAAGVWGENQQRAAQTAIERQQEINELTEKYGTVAEGTGAKLLALWDQQAAAQERTYLATQQTKGLFSELSSFADRAFDRIGSAITTMFVQGSGAAVQWKNIVSGVISELYQEFLKLAVLNPIKNALFGQSAPTLGGIGGLFGNLFGGSSGGGVVSVTGPIATIHTGGVVGETPMASKIVDLSIFRNAPRYHSGLNLMPDERPAILQTGERVIPRGGSANDNSNNMTVFIDATGADPAGLARVEAAVRELHGTFEKRAVSAVVQARQRQPRLFGNKVA